MGLQLAVSLEQRTESARGIRCSSLPIGLDRRHRSASVAQCRQGSNCVKAPMRFAFQEDQSPGLFQQSSGCSGTLQLDYSATSAKGYALIQKRGAYVVGDRGRYPGRGRSRRGAPDLIKQINKTIGSVVLATWRSASFRTSLRASKQPQFPMGRGHLQTRWYRPENYIGELNTTSRILAASRTNAHAACRDILGCLQ